MEKDQVKWGVMFSYMLIVFNTLFSLLIIPYMIGRLGEAEYGVYKTVASMASSMMVLDLGMGSTVMRYVAKYRAAGQEKEISNYLAMSLIQAGGACLLLLLTLLPARSSVNLIYGKTFTHTQLQTAKTVLPVLILNVVLHIVENVISGVIVGSNRFFFGNGIKLLRLLARSALLLLLLIFFPKAQTIALIDITVTALVLVAECLYVIRRMKIRIRLTYWDRSVFMESGKYTVLMFMQNLTIQFNGQVDSVLIGAMINSGSVTIYSMALTIFALYENLSGAVSSVMLPSVTKLVEEKKTPTELQSYVERVGRIQFAAMGAFLGGFIILGKDFYQLWLGAAYTDCYCLTLILIIPTTFPIIQNVVLSVLRAQNRMGYRTVALLCAMMVNILVSILGIRNWGYWGAAIGTAASTLVSFLLMNVYYHFRLEFRIRKMYARIFARTIVCVVAAMGITAILHMNFQMSWSSFILCGSIYSVIYGGLMILWGFSETERRMLRIPTRRIKV